MSNPLTHLIWSNEHSGWWRPGGWGYSKDICEAGRYTAEEACAIVKQATTVQKWDKVPTELAVRIDDLPEAARALLGTKAADRLLKIEKALLAWVEMQSTENTHRLYDAALKHFGIKPVIPD